MILLAALAFVAACVFFGYAAMMGRLSLFSLHYFASLLGLLLFGIYTIVLITGNPIGAPQLIQMGIMLVGTYIFASAHPQMIIDWRTNAIGQKIMSEIVAEAEDLDAALSMTRILERNATQRAQPHTREEAMQAQEGFWEVLRTHLARRYDDAQV